MSSSAHGTEGRRPVFVVGYMHSGTTLLLNVLGGHPDVFGPDHETKYFMHLDLVRRHIGAAGGDPIKTARAFARSVIEDGFPIFDTPPGRPAHLSDNEVGQAFRSAMDEATRSRGLIRWIEKTPTHVFHARQIAAAIPDAIFLEVVRDPRDVIASKKTRTESVWTSERYRPEERARKHLEKSFDPLWDSLAWVSAVRTADSARVGLADRWKRLRYEDLVDDAGPVIADACRFIGLDYADTMLDVERGIPADPDEPTDFLTGVSATSVGRWRWTLDPVEVTICERISRREMELLGYEPESTGGAVHSIGRVVFTSLPGLIVRLWHRFRLGGSSYLIEVIKGLARRVRASMSR